MTRRRLIHFFTPFTPVLILAFLPQVASAQAPAKRALQIEDYYRVKSVGAPQFSPDGQWVSFTVSTRVESTNGNTSELWLARADGSTPASPLSIGGEVVTNG